MSGLVDRLALVITANGAGAIKEFQKVGAAAEKDLKKAEDRTKKVGSQMQATGVAMIGAGALIVGAMVETAKASEEANVQHLKLDNTLKNSPQLAGANKQAFLDQATAMQKLVVVDDEAVIGVQALLGQFGLTQDRITEVTPLVVDLSRKMGIDLDTAAKMVGKSVEGSSGALKKAGIVVDENAFKTDHYRATVDALALKVGGYAASEGATFAGQLEITKNRLHDVEEGIGVGAVGALNKMLGPVQSASERFTELDAGTQSTIGSIGAFAGAGLIAAGAASTLIGSLIKMKANFTAAGEAAKGMSVSGAASIAGLGVAIAGVLVYIDHLNQSTKETNDGLFKGLDYSDLERANSKLNQTGDEINKLGDKWNSYSAVQKLQHAEDYKIWQDASAQQEENRKHLDASIDATKRLGQTMGISARDAEDLVAKMKIDPASIPFEKLVDMVRRFKDGTLSAADAQAELGGATEDTAKTFDEATKKLKGYYDQLFGTVDLERNAAESHQSLADTIAKNNAIQYAAFDNSTKAGRENQKAFEDAAKAELELAESNIKAGGDIGQNTAQVNTQIAALRNQMVQHGFSAAAVDNYVAKLGLTPAQVTTQFSAPGLAEAAGNAERLNNAVAAVASQVGNLSTSGKGGGTLFGSSINLGFRAAGGPVSAGKPYLVGEKGPELMVPGSSGTIVNNDQLGQVAASAGGSSAPIETTIILQVDSEVLTRVLHRREASIR